MSEEVRAHPLTAPAVAPRGRQFPGAPHWALERHDRADAAQKMRSLLTDAFKEKAAEADMNQINRLIIKGRMELEETMMLWKGDSHVIGWLETRAEQRVAAAKAKTKTAFLDKFFG
mmetsp:Transcript_10154/g.30081  ORF Transcript_10154/g.30081 Transcript_10154/m.30081 type:complete len:116 (-) Transcript_10154:398-745(-)